MSTGESLDWLVFGWEQQRAGLALLRSSLPPEEWEAWDRRLFTLVEVQRDAGAASSQSLCRLVIDGEPVALHRRPTSDPDPRRRIQTYAYKGAPSVLGPRQVLGVVDDWYKRLPKTVEGPPLDPATPLPLTPTLQEALTGRVRGAEPGVTPAALSPLAAGLPRLVAEVLRNPEAMFSCLLPPGADAKVVMWGLLDLLDRVVGTTDNRYWAFSTEQSDDVEAGLPRFVFLAEWPYSSKRSRHTRVDLSEELDPDDRYDTAASRLVEAYLCDPAEVPALCRAARLKERAPDRRQIEALLRYFDSHPYGRSATRPEPDVTEEPLWDEGDLLAPREGEGHAEVSGTEPDAEPEPPPGQFGVPDPFFTAGGPPGDAPAGDTTGATRAYWRGGRPPRPYQPSRRGIDEFNMLEPEPEPEPAARRPVPRLAAPETPGANEVLRMAALVHSLRWEKSGDDLRGYLDLFSVSARADPENRAVLRAALEKFGCFHDKLSDLLPEQEVKNALSDMTASAFHDADMADVEVFESSARLAGRQDTPSAVVTELMELVARTTPDRTREWMDIAAEPSARSARRSHDGPADFLAPPDYWPEDMSAAVPPQGKERWWRRRRQAGVGETVAMEDMASHPRTGPSAGAPDTTRAVDLPDVRGGSSERSGTGREVPRRPQGDRATGLESPWVAVVIVVVLLTALAVLILTS